MNYAAKPVSILLADDEKHESYLFKWALRKTRLVHQLQTVDNGEELIDYLSEKQENLPDVLFLDLHMPGKTGRECLNEIKSNEKLKQIPIVIYSNSLRENVADSLYEIGAHYYFQKRDFDKLPAAIESLVTLLAKNPEQPEKEKFIYKEQGL